MDRKNIKFKKPDAFLLENVKHLKGHDKGNTLKVILKSLRKNYYVPDPKVLNAKDFGLPQNRERIYIVGFRKKINDFNFPNLKNIKTKLGDILETNPDKKYTISSRLWSGHKRRKYSIEKRQWIWIWSF